MNAVGKRILVLCLSLCVLAFVVFQISRFFYRPFKSETAIEYSVQDSLREKGVFIRSEAVLPDTVSGFINYDFPDASRVIGGETVAKEYSDRGSANNERIAQELEQEIQMLKECQAQRGTNVLKTDVLSKQITDDVGKLVDQSGDVMFTDLAGLKSSITTYINKKQIVTGAVTDFSQRISELETRKGQLDITKSVREIKAPETGYFVSQTDGFESLAIGADISHLSVDKINTLMETPVQPNGGSVGKIITDYRWYFALTVTGEEAKKFYEGQQVGLDFSITSFAQVPVTVERIVPSSTGQDEVGIVFSGIYMSDQLAQMRVQNVNVVFKRFSGLRVSESAIHHTNNETWIYKISNTEIKKVPVEVLYTGIGYVICSDISSDTNKLSLYDEVIVEGSDLYDGKTIR